MGNDNINMCVNRASFIEAGFEEGQCQKQRGGGSTEDRSALSILMYARR